MISFTYSPLVLQLRNPVPGNRKILVFNQTIKRAMSGKIYTYKSLPPIVKLELDFERENRPKMLEIINFLRVSAGQLISYVDHHANTFSVKMLTAPFDETHVGRGNNVFTLQLEIV